ncbi:MAG: hypothetical protein AAF360_01370 [Pseudomonadota bacterium]
MTLRVGLRVLGGAAAVLLIGWAIYRYGADAPRVNWRDPAAWSALTMATLLYLAVLIGGGRIWKLLLAGFGADMPPGRAESQLLVAQIGKYVPGNFAHFAGRVGLSIKDGAAPARAGGALIAETLITLAVGGVVVLSGFLLAPSLLAALNAGIPIEIDGRLLALGAGLAGLVIVGGLVIARRHLAALASLRLASGAAALIFAIQLGAFIALGAGLQLVAGLAGDGAPRLIPCVVVFAFAWVAGMITPGAPGGVGVRETAITIGLGPEIGEPAALTAALLLRGVTVAGDVVAFALGLYLRRRA